MVPGNSAIMTPILGLLSDPNSKVVGDFQLGDQQVTLNHLDVVSPTLLERWKKTPGSLRKSKRSKNLSLKNMNQHLI